MCSTHSMESDPDVEPPSCRHPADKYTISGTQLYTGPCSPTAQPCVEVHQLQTALIHSAGSQPSFGLSPEPQTPPHHWWCSQRSTGTASRCSPRQQPPAADGCGRAGIHSVFALNQQRWSVTCSAWKSTICIAWICISALHIAADR
jgi:hypothetical protein